MFCLLAILYLINFDKASPVTSDDEFKMQIHCLPQNKTTQPNSLPCYERGIVNYK